jgi:hypothetical protein
MPEISGEINRIYFSNSISKLSTVAEKIVQTDESTKFFTIFIVFNFFDKFTDVLN